MTNAKKKPRNVGNGKLYRAWVDHYTLLGITSTKRIDYLARKKAQRGIWPTPEKETG